MSVKITYFVHGTTTDNENGLSTGWAQGKLSELGINQAKELGKLTKDQQFDVVFCSDLNRAVHSAELGFADKHKIIIDERLRECNYGDLNEASEHDVIYENHINEPFPNGENLKDVKKRIADFLEFLKSNYDGKHIAILAHKAPQLALEVLLNNKTWEQSIDTDWRKTKSWQPGWKYNAQ
ncbi:MAG: histidine phosphatase family protein [Candidatus Magasanikbacteria bacterium]|jgi:broad specificity phosphatase PhoE|nr:histidine phosphatase family protein [Candidatus Magasanikbacteria bacterium]MBT4314938.1 histidine phosphatase family protein [Candidatus Magasanikbacteria bacterium]MBT4546894.1 histidine phosphatase family protein [Candidatus Magasanikbacteria bacterium]MBT6819192.1 histidine phosphatase family protein [Candidatus Magasanikbacteria bacterium]